MHNVENRSNSIWVCLNFYRLRYVIENIRCESKSKSAREVVWRAAADDLNGPFLASEAGEARVLPRSSHYLSRISNHLDALSRDSGRATADLAARMH
jgi:hypothetical protein